METTLQEGYPVKNVVDSALEAASTAMHLDVEGVPYLLVPDNRTLHNLESLLVTPTRAKGSVSLDDTDSFIAYINALKVDSTRIFCDADFGKAKAQYSALFNDHTLAAPGWRDLRATYAPRPSEEWTRWTARNAKPQSQVDFATFIEDNMRDIATADGLPSGSDMLEMAISLEINNDSRFKSAIRLQSGGVDLTFVDKENDATLEKMRVFDRFAIGIPPFFNGPAYRIEARLRYRAKDGALTFWYELIRADLTVADAVRTEIQKIADGTGIGVLYGRP